MDDDRTAKQKPPRWDERDAPRSRAASAAHQDETERKPTPIEPREWRGSGVCGDRHTD